MGYIFIEMYSYLFYIFKTMHCSLSDSVMLLSLLLLLFYYYCYYYVWQIEEPRNVPPGSSCIS